jgi:hypothetical protein
VSQHLLPHSNQALASSARIPLACVTDAHGPNLNLWKHQLGYVPDAVWSRTDLETLVLAENALSELSERIGSLNTCGCSISGTTS